MAKKRWEQSITFAFYYVNLTFNWYKHNFILIVRNLSISPIDILRTAHLRRALLLGCVALQLTTGLWPTLYLSTDLLRRVNISDSLSEWASTIMITLSTISTTIGMSVVDRFGRRPLLIGFGAANMTAMLIFVICAVVEPMIGVARYGCVAMLFVYGITYR